MTLPKTTPIKLDNIRANDAAMNTTTGDPVSAVSNKVANCVLSPSSAIKTVVKVVRIVV